jgi:hypothetical protein
VTTGVVVIVGLEWYYPPIVVMVVIVAVFAVQQLVRVRQKKVRIGSKIIQDGFEATAVKVKRSQGSLTLSVNIVIQKIEVCGRQLP